MCSQIEGMVPEYQIMPSWRDVAHDGVLCTFSNRSVHRAHTEWQRPPSSVHSIMMEKFVQAGEVGGCKPTHFHSIYHHVCSCVEECIVYNEAEG